MEEYWFYPIVAKTQIVDVNNAKYVVNHFHSSVKSVIQRLGPYLGVSCLF